VSTAYVSVYCAAGNYVFGVFEPAARVRFTAAASGHEQAGTDVAVELTNRRTGFSYSILTNSRFMGYVPTALVAALILATPLGWRRRGRALLWGLLAINAFIAVRLLLSVLTALSGQSPLALFSPGPWLSACLRALFTLLVVSSAGAFVVPLIVWALACFRRSEWQAILNRASQSDSD
jgi:hypothetical protein